MLMMGVDPGTGTTGYAFVREDDEDGTLYAVGYGVIQTDTKAPMPQRLQHLYRRMGDLIKEYEPDEVAVEEMFFGRNITTAIMVAQGRGVSLLAMADAGLVIREYKPAEIKQTIAGAGNAPKKQVQQMVQTLLNLDEIPRPDDAADALACAITALQASRWERLSQG